MYFLVPIRGDAYRAMGLLAKVGIQNVVVPEERAKRVTARLSSESPRAPAGALWRHSRTSRSWSRLPAKNESRVSAAILQPFTQAQTDAMHVADRRGRDRGSGFGGAASSSTLDTRATMTERLHAAIVGQRLTHPNDEGAGSPVLRYR